MKTILVVAFLTAVLLVKIPFALPAASNQLFTESTLTGHLGLASCVIVGALVWPKEYMEPRIRLSASCPIHIERDGRYIKMSSAKWFVVVDIPEDPRPRGFLYVWGERTATIGEQQVAVSYGPALGI